MAQAKARIQRLPKLVRNAVANARDTSISGEVSDEQVLSPMELLEWMHGLLPAGQGQNLALTVVYVPQPNVAPAWKSSGGGRAFVEMITPPMSLQY